jgi:hypothetical protein
MPPPEAGDLAKAALQTLDLGHGLVTLVDTQRGLDGAESRWHGWHVVGVHYLTNLDVLPADLGIDYATAVIDYANEAASP